MKEVRLVQVKQVLAALAVTDMQASEAWYRQLFDRPADAHPMDGLVEWHFGDAQVLQVVADAERAGGSLVTLFVDDLGEASEAETTSGAAFRRVDDPDGNGLTLVGK
jgi:glyoxylase I family protein